MRKKKMETIFFSESEKIQYDDQSVLINGEKINDDRLNGCSPEIFASKTMRSLYSSMLSKQFDNIVVLSGAGTSVGIGMNDKVGQTMNGLWGKVLERFQYEELQILAKKIGFSELKKDSTNLEELLSRAILAAEFLPQQETIQTWIHNIEKIIIENCSIELPDNAPHLVFIRKLTARKLKYARVKLFTLNYDLLFEQAASKGGYVLIDGFSFNPQRIFDGTSFDYDIVIRNNSRTVTEENYAPKVFHIYKPHGSLDWKCEKQENRTIFVKANPNDSPVLIYPSNSKFKHSYEQPFFEMISRFQQELRTRNTLLISVGFSFYDLHFKTMIMEAINTNPSITLIVVNPDVSDENKYRELKVKSMSMKNIVLINEKFDDFARYFPYSDIYDYSNESINHESI
jgi:NAD-dependent SIR2 family protein deacetylase